jgi:ANTAR domain
VVIAGRIIYDTLGPVVGRGRPDGILIERAKGALMERKRLDDQEAFAHLRRAARSSGRKLSEVDREVAAGQPLPRGRTRPTPAQTEQPKSDTSDPQQEA